MVFNVILSLFVLLYKTNCRLEAWIKNHWKGTKTRKTKSLFFLLRFDVLNSILLSENDDYLKLWTSFSNEHQCTNHNGTFCEEGQLWFIFYHFQKVTSGKGQWFDLSQKLFVKFRIDSDLTQRNKITNELSWDNSVKLFKSIYWFCSNENKN